MVAPQPARPAARDVQLDRLSRLTRRVTYGAVALAGLFAAAFATATPHHSTSVRPQHQAPVNGPGAQGRSGTDRPGGQLQPPPAPPGQAPAPAAPDVQSGGS